MQAGNKESLATQQFPDFLEPGLPSLYSVIGQKARQEIIIHREPLEVQESAAFKMGEDQQHPVLPCKIAGDGGAGIADDGRLLPIRNQSHITAPGICQK